MYSKYKVSGDIIWQLWQSLFVVSFHHTIYSTILIASCLVPPLHFCSLSVHSWYRVRVVFKIFLKAIFLKLLGWFIIKFSPFNMILSSYSHLSLHLHFQLLSAHYFLSILIFYYLECSRLFPVQVISEKLIALPVLLPTLS